MFGVVVSAIVLVVVVGSLFFNKGITGDYTNLEKIDENLAVGSDYSPDAGVVSLKGELYSEWIGFESKYGDWNVLWDEDSKRPVRIYGMGIPVNDLGFVEVSSDNVDDVSKKFIEDNNNLLNVDSSDLEVVGMNGKGEVGEIVQIGYQQKYNGILVQNSFVSVAYKDDNLVSYHANYYDVSGVDLEAKISGLEAYEIASIKFDIKPSNTLDPQVDLVIYPVVDNKGYKLAYNVELPFFQDHQYNVIVDAGNGEVLDYYDNVRTSVSGNIKGNILQEHVGNDFVEKEFSSEYVELGELQVVSNNKGNFFGEVEGDVELSSKLQGPWVEVIDFDDLRYIRSFDIDFDNNKFYAFDRYHGEIINFGLDGKDIKMSVPYRKCIEDTEIIFIEEENKLAYVNFRYAGMFFGYNLCSGQGSELHGFDLDTSEDDIFYKYDGTASRQIIDIDYGDSSVYWVFKVGFDSGETIYKTSLDGATTEQIYFTGVNNEIYAMVLDLENRKIFWSEIAGSLPHVNRLFVSDLENFERQEVLDKGTTQIRSLSVDTTNEKVFLGISGGVNMVDYSGENEIVLLRDDNCRYYNTIDLEYDKESNILYYLTPNLGECKDMGKINIDNLLLSILLQINYLIHYIFICCCSN